MSQKFMVQFSVTTECDEVVDADAVRQWAEEIFVGCDLGSVVVETVTPVHAPTAKPVSTPAKRRNQCLRPCIPVCNRDRAPGDVFCRECREEERDYDRQAQNP